MFTDLRTGTVLGDMPMHGVTFDRQLNKAGNLSASTNLDNDWLDNDDIKGYTEEGRTCIYVYRDDLIVWGGIIWSRTYQSQAKAISINAQTFESYAYKRYYRPSSTVVYDQGQCLTVNALWVALQSEFGGNIGVEEETFFPSGDVERRIQIDPWDFRTFGEIIDNITKFQTGCDYTIEVAEEAGRPTKKLSLGYPRLGNIVEYSALVLDYPGNILNYYRTGNASESSNRHYATGDGDGEAIVVGVASDASKIEAGYPLLEATSSHSGVTQQDTIDEHAATGLTTKPIGKQKFSIGIKADEEPVFGTYNLGDDAQVTIEDPWYPTGIEFPVRVVGWNVTPSSSESTEEMSLVIEGDEAEEVVE